MGRKTILFFVNYTKLQPDIQEKCYLQPELHITLIGTINNGCSNYIGTSDVIDHLLVSFALELFETILSFQLHLSHRLSLNFRLLK